MTVNSTVNPRLYCQNYTGPTQPVGRGYFVARGNTLMLPTETFEMGKSLLKFSLAEPGYNAEAILKSYGLCIYGIINYLTDLFCKAVRKIATS
jgi:hypothetical protein